MNVNTLIEPIKYSGHALVSGLTSGGIPNGSSGGELTGNTPKSWQLVGGINVGGINDGTSKPTLSIPYVPDWGFVELANALPDLNNSPAVQNVEDWYEMLSSPFPEVVESKPAYPEDGGDIYWNGRNSASKCLTA